jgi:hypothetical protein
MIMTLNEILDCADVLRQQLTGWNYEQLTQEQRDSLQAELTMLLNMTPSEA